MPEQSSSVAVQVRKYGIAGIEVHLAGFALGTVSIALVLSGAVGIESGLAVLTPFADLLYGLGLVMVVAVAARAGVPMKYLIIVGAVIGVGLLQVGPVRVSHSFRHRIRASAQWPRRDGNYTDNRFCCSACNTGACLQQVQAAW